MKKAQKQVGKHAGCLFIRNIPKDLKNMFKGTCSRRGDSMTLVIESMLRMYIDNPSSVRIINKGEDWK